MDTRASERRVGYGWRFAVLGIVLGTLTACGGGGGVGDQGSNKTPTLPAFAFGVNQDLGLPTLLPTDVRDRAAGDVNLHLQGLLPPVGAQGNQPSCVGWAVAYYVRSIQERAGNPLWDLGTDSAPNYDHIYSPAFLYNQRTNRLAAGEASRGMEVSEAIELLVTSGCCVWSAMPYDALDSDTQPSGPAFSDASTHRVRALRRFGRTDGIDLASVDEMKGWLDTNQPLILSMNVHAPFRDFRGEDHGVIVEAKGAEAALGQHAVAVVGYGDEVAGGSFLVVNSWGTNWGDLGFAWLPYDQVITIAPVGADGVGIAAYAVIEGAPPSGVPPIPTGNDLLTGAGTINNGETVSGMVGNILDDPADWWSFTAQASDRATISLFGLAADVDIELTDGSETLLAFSYNALTFDEEIVFTFPDTGTYYVKVVPYDDVASSYFLSLDVVPGQPNDIPSGAMPMAFDVDETGTVGAADGTDWWKFDVVGDGIVTVTLTGLADDIDLEVFDEFTALNFLYLGVPIDGSYNIFTEDEQVTFQALAGTYYVRVVPWGGAISAYTLRVSNGGPEIKVTAFDITEVAFADRVEITVNNLEIKNEGVFASGWVDVAMGLSQTTTPGDVYWFMPDGYRWTSDPIPAGGTFSWNTGTETIWFDGITPPGTYYVMCHADFFWGYHEGWIPEGNENDNYFYDGGAAVSVP